MKKRDGEVDWRESLTGKGMTSFVAFAYIIRIICAFDLNPRVITKSLDSDYQYLQQPLIKTGQK